MDDFNLELDSIENNAEEKLKAKNRFQTLSEKNISLIQEKEQVEAQAKAEAEARLNAEKERDFFKDFSSKSSKYPGAAEHQEKIWEKVKSGYDTEDAMVAVLAKEGKLPSAPEVKQPQATVEGGSASTSFTDGSSKDLKDMSTQDKLNALQELERQGGISLN